MSNMLFANIFHSPKLRWHLVLLQIKLQCFFCLFKYSKFSEIFFSLHLYLKVYFTELSFYWIVLSNSNYRQFSPLWLSYIVQRQLKKFKVQNVEELLVGLWSFTQFLHIEWNGFAGSNNNLDLMMCMCTQAQCQIQLIFNLQREEYNYLCSAKKVEENAYILSSSKIWKLLIKETVPLPFPEATGSSAALTYLLNMTLKWAFRGSFQVTATAEKRSNLFPLLPGLNGNSAGDGWRN